MKIFITGVNGQLGHDVLNEAAGRGYDVIGSDISEAYAGIADGTAVCSAPYERLDITDEAAVHALITRLQPDEEGFDYPVVDQQKCIKCHRCINVCPFKSLPFKVL